MTYPPDHSLTYVGTDLRNIPHRMRLRHIERVIRRLDIPPDPIYLDIGCSNGFVTDRIRKLVRAKRAFGYDFEEEYFERGRERYPEISFHQVNLNAVGNHFPTSDLITCFETLEHVGNLEGAVENIVSAMNPGAAALITVPIEIGWRGTFKFLVKIFLFRYDLEELPQSEGLFWRYLRALLTGARLSRFRDERSGWGTHFGFDYRDVDHALKRRNIRFSAHNSGFTRFYLVET